MELQDILTSFASYSPNGDMELIKRAHAFAIEHHKGQTRVSGEPYIAHLREVSMLATKLKLDSASIATALLHDTVEDTDVSLDLIQATFGKEVAELVDGITKLSQVKFFSKEEAQAENFRKMLLAMAKDIRVVLLKLCDRLHNMRTLEFLSEARRDRIAKETIDIYAPLAHRLGIYWMKSELEDLCLRFLHPVVYQTIKEKVATSKKEREIYINEVVALLQKELKENNIVGDVSGRPKHFYSIYQKMDKSSIEFDEIYDLIAFRIMVSSTIDCYSALGVVHAGWKPVPGRFKDYIAMPKSNGYQSLHTTLIGPRAHKIEVQIRTSTMHDVAERGVAAHWMYKEHGKSGKDGSKDNNKDGAKETGKKHKAKGMDLDWIKNLVESENTLKDPLEFLSSVKEDLFPDEVFVFTPKGDLISMPKNSTPIDFAFQVHTTVGERCTGARANGQHVPLSYKLRNGDTIDITTSESQRPSKDWLSIVVTNKAKQKIRSHVREEERARSIEIGKELLSKDLRKIKRSINTVTKDGSLLKIAHELDIKDIDSLFADIGYGKVSAKAVITKVAPEIVNIEEQLGKEESFLQKVFQKAAKALKDTSGIRVEGIDNMICKFAKCCQPLPGDPVIGFVSRGRGVVIHTRQCSQALSFDRERLVDVQWDEKVKTTRGVTIDVNCINKVGVLAALTQTISSNGANISSAQISSKPNGQSVCSFDVTVNSAKQLHTLVKSIEKVDGVIRVERRSLERGAQFNN